MPRGGWPCHTAGSPIVCVPGYCRSAAPGLTRPLPLKCQSSRSPSYGVAPTAMGSCISSSRSPPPSSSLPHERSSTPLIPHRTWLSTGTPACSRHAHSSCACRPNRAFRQPVVHASGLTQTPSSLDSRIPSEAFSRYHHPQLSDLCNHSGDPNPIAQTFVARHTSGFLQTALSDLLRARLTSLPACSCGAAPIEY